VGLKSLKSLNLTNGYPNNNKNNKVKSKPLELRSRVKSYRLVNAGVLTTVRVGVLTSDHTTVGVTTTSHCTHGGCRPSAG
jgi:hypothetical protein